MSEATLGPWALIAGGSEGIGACLAHELAARGVNLALVARKAGALEQTAREIRERSGVEVRTLSLDLTDADAVDRIEQLTDGCEIGTLVYNAGAAHKVTALLDTPEEQALALVRLNCLTLVQVMHRYATRMRSRGTGNVLLFGSGAGACGVAGLAVYAAAKAFVEKLAEGLWYEFAPHGVRVLCLVPGLTQTPAMERAGFRSAAGFEVEDPAVVARAALAHLGDGPVQVRPGLAPILDALAKMPSGERVKMMSEATAAMVTAHR
jgi:short-subunit dehydrogenase